MKKGLSFAITDNDEYVCSIYLNNSMYSSSKVAIDQIMLLLNKLDLLNDEHSIISKSTIVRRVINFVSSLNGYFFSKKSSEKFKKFYIEPLKNIGLNLEDIEQKIKILDGKANFEIQLAYDIDDNISVLDTSKLFCCYDISNKTLDVENCFVLSDIFNYYDECGAVSEEEINDALEKLLENTVSVPNLCEITSIEQLEIIKKELDLVDIETVFKDDYNDIIGFY